MIDMNYMSKDYKIYNIKFLKFNINYYEKLKTIEHILEFRLINEYNIYNKNQFSEILNELIDNIIKQYNCFKFVLNITSQQYDFHYKNENNLICIDEIMDHLENLWLSDSVNILNINDIITLKLFIKY